jgi:hypothetical protein
VPPQIPTAARALTGRLKVAHADLDYLIVEDG